MHTTIATGGNGSGFDTAGERGSLLYMSLVCFVAAIGGLLFGFDTAVISGTIVFLKKQFALTSWTEGWVVSSALIGCIIGSAVAGTLADRFGRKKILVLSGVLFLASAFGTMLPRTVFELICGRLVGGLGVGVASMLAPLFISEFSPPRLRGRMVALYQLAITIGVVAAYFSNALLLHLAENVWSGLPEGYLRWILVDEVWRGMFGTLGGPAILFLFLLLFIPESPRWLTKQGRSDEALAILSKVGGRSVATKEVKEIQEAVATEGGSLSQVLEPWLRTALIIGILLPVFSQFSGINVIIYYGPKILDQAKVSMGSALNGQVIIGLVNVFFTVIAIWKVDQFGRKPLLLAGIVGLVLTLTLVGSMFPRQPDLPTCGARVALTTTLGGTPLPAPLLVANPAEAGIPPLVGGETLVLCFALYCACFAFSLGPIPWVIISEIFPTRIRGRAMSIGTFSIWGGCTIVAQTFPWLSENFGPARTFWLYAAVLVPAFLFVLRLVPETKGKSLEQIEHFWKEHHSSKS